MVDFKKLREAKSQAAAVDPIEIFRRLPKPSGINDLYSSQTQALEKWFLRRRETDLAIKLHTGGGKTLVGLLIGQSLLNEYKEPVLYLSPNVQLVKQTLQKARDYGIPTVEYVKGQELSSLFYDGQAILVCNYNALFNGISKFKLKGDPEWKRVGGIILDDAHASFSTVRDCFTLKVDRKRNEEDYLTFANLFRHDFDLLGKLGTFDDVVADHDFAVLDVPYWSWKAKTQAVRHFFQSRAEQFIFEWPFLRDTLDRCLCLISSSSIVVTPMMPMVDMLPSFANCKRRIYMSATIGDDSAIVHTFGASVESISNPINSESLAGISERMLLVPELMGFSIRLYWR